MIPTIVSVTPNLSIDAALVEALNVERLHCGCRGPADHDPLCRGQRWTVAIHLTTGNVYALEPDGFDSEERAQTQLMIARSRFRAASDNAATALRWLRQVGGVVPLQHGDRIARLCDTIEHGAELPAPPEPSLP